MSKTLFQEFGTVVTAKFLQAIFGQGADGGHKHDGKDEDGHCGLIDQSQLADDVKAKIVVMGQVVAYAGLTAPDGWLMCNGTAVPAGEKYNAFRTWISENASYLIADNIFRTPDLRGRVVVGIGTGFDGINDVKQFTAGEVGGEYKHTLTVEELAEHSHRSLIYNRAGYTRDGSGNAVSYTGPNGIPENGPLGESLTFDTGEIGTTGEETSLNGHGRNTPTLLKVEANKSHNNTQPYFAMNYIICAV